jgi:hypothetical protein
MKPIATIFHLENGLWTVRIRSVCGWKVFQSKSKKEALAWLGSQG